MEDFFKKSILYDLYGNILSKKEQVVYEYHIIDDLSFNEIGEELKISRQAAYDLFKNADKRLIEIDSKLKLSTRLKEIEKLAESIRKDAESIEKGTSKNDAESIHLKTREIINLSNKIIKKVKEGGNN